MRPGFKTPGARDFTTLFLNKIVAAGVGWFSPRVKARSFSDEISFVHPG